MADMTKAIGTKRPNDWELIQSVVGVSRRVLIYGPAALGKSYLAQHYNRQENEEVISLTLREDSTATELIGFFMPKGKEFVWFDGPVVRAWRLSHKQKVRLVINEIDHASGEVFTLLMAALDDIDSARLTLTNNETVQPGKGLFVVATMNGDPYQDLTEPLRSRFPVRVNVTKVNPEAIKALSEDLRVIAKTTSELKDPKERIDLRAWAEFDYLRGILGDDKAAWACFGDRTPDLIANIKLSR